MKKVVLGIGVPGSGKTTTLKNFATNQEYTYICPDDIRMELCGNASDQSRNKEVWTESYNRTADALKKEQTVVFDATFANPDQRIAFITFAKENGADKVQGVWLDIPKEVALERNENRERTVPPFVIDRMHGQIEENIPNLTDGFDGIFRIDENNTLVEATIEYDNKEISREFNIPMK